MTIFGYYTIASVVAMTPYRFVGPVFSDSFARLIKLLASGASNVWVMLIGGYVSISLHFMRIRLLPREKWRWYWMANKPTLS